MTTPPDAPITPDTKDWTWVLAGDGDLRARPRPDVWSPLEYACHVRDVCRVYRTRLHLMLTQEGAAFLDWNQDATAVEQRYREQDPAVVSGELVEAARELANAFAAVTGPQ